MLAFGKTTQEVFMSDLGTLKVGRRSVPFYYFTGVVENRSDSSHTTTTHEQGTNRVVSSYTDHRSDLIVRGADGSTEQVNSLLGHISVSVGSKITLVMVDLGKKDLKPYVALHDHGTGKTGYFAKGVNDAAGPPLYNMGIIIALIVIAVSVIGFSFGKIVPLGLAAWFFYELYRRRKLVREHADRIIAKYKQ
jgi:hypothetical protein